MRQIETPKRLSRQQLTDKLVALIFTGKTDMTANAKTLGIGRATVYRYWNKWTESEEAQQVSIEWWAMFRTLKRKSPIKAFEGLTRLKFKAMPEKIEAKQADYIRHEIILVKPDESHPPTQDSV
jgi:hypothetical protein